MSLPRTRTQAQIDASLALASLMAERHPTAVDWHVSVTGAVCTGVVTPPLDGVRYGAAVVALAPDVLYLEVRELGDPRHAPGDPFTTDLVPVASPEEAEWLWIKTVKARLAEGRRIQP